MKKRIAFVVVALLFFVPFSASSHPGKTDRYGGHKCIKGCEEWKLYYKEYHLHDKDGRPIRVNKKKQLPVQELVSMPVETPAPVQEPPATAPTVTVYKYVQIYEQEVSLFNPLLCVLLVLLMVLLILRLTRKKKIDQ